MGGSVLESLFTETETQVLKLLLLNPHRDFYQREIADLAGQHLRSVQQVLARLVAGEIVVREARGRQVYYRANSSCPILAELTAIFVKTVGLADRVRDGLAALADAVQVALIFGSWARGEQQPQSDVDLLVIGEVSLREVVSALSEAAGELGRELNPLVMSGQEFCERLQDGDHFVTSVVGGPKIWLVGDEHDLERVGRQGSD